MPIIPQVIETCPRCGHRIISVKITGNTNESVNISCGFCDYPLISFG